MVERTTARTQKAHGCPRTQEFRYFTSYSFFIIVGRGFLIKNFSKKCSHDLLYSRSNIFGLCNVLFLWKIKLKLLTFREKVWFALKDQNQQTREAAAEALQATLALIADRFNTQNDKSNKQDLWYQNVLDECSKVSTKITSNTQIEFNSKQKIDIQNKQCGFRSRWIISIRRIIEGFWPFYSN